MNLTNQLFSHYFSVENSKNANLVGINYKYPYKFKYWTFVCMLSSLHKIVYI
jgi:hypothetical protein